MIFNMIIIFLIQLVCGAVLISSEPELESFRPLTTAPVSFYFTYLYGNSFSKKTSLNEYLLLFGRNKQDIRSCVRKLLQESSTSIYLFLILFIF